MRLEFPKRVKLEAWQRSGGNCDACGAHLYPGKWHLDHIKPSAFGGEPVLDNAACLCLPCHTRKTGTKDIPAVAKSNRVRAKHLGFQKKRGPGLPGSRRSRWKRKLDGTVVERK